MTGNEMGAEKRRHTDHEAQGESEGDFPGGTLSVL